jgi:hypothetical protein
MAKAEATAFFRLSIAIFSGFVIRMADQGISSMSDRAGNGFNRFPARCIRGKSTLKQLKQSLPLSDV